MVVGAIETIAVRDGGLIEVREQEDPEAMPRAGRDAKLKEWPLHRAGREVAGRRFVVQHGKTLLTEAIEAIGTARGFANALNRRQDDGDENGDDGNDDQQLDQGKAAARWRGTGHDRTAKERARSNDRAPSRGKCTTKK